MREQHARSAVYNLPSSTSTTTLFQLVCPQERQDLLVQDRRHRAGEMGRGVL